MFGMIAGRSAAEYVKTVEHQEISDLPVIAEKEKLFSAIWDREEGAHWKEPASTLQQIMNDYIPAMTPRTENLFRVGIKYLNDLKKLCHEEMVAENSMNLCVRGMDQIDIRAKHWLLPPPPKRKPWSPSTFGLQIHRLTLITKYAVIGTL